MGFLNGLLLLGALAFLVPLIIHLLNRSKFQTIEWGAMHLLENLEQQNSRRFQWQAWLLLLLRCLIPLVLAFCMARPIWNWWMASGTSGAATTVLVIDDSFSMQAKSSAASEPQRLTLFENSRSQVQEVINGVGGRSAKSIITTGGSSTPVTDGTSYDSRPIERQLERLEPAAASSNPAAALQLAIETAAKTQDPYRQILVWSDFQKHDWQNVPSASWATLRERLSQLPVPASIHLFPQSAEPTENVSLWIDGDTTELALTGEPFEVRAVVTNRGEQAVTGLPLRVLVDDQEIATKRIDLAPRAEQQLAFLITLEEPGSHLVNMSIDDRTGMNGDDADALPVEALKPIRVLLVENRNDLPLLELETGFLQVAWQTTVREEGAPQGIVVQRVTSDRLTAELLSERDVIVLANVSRVRDEVARALAQQVAAGLTLFVFGGDQVDRNWYEQQWGANAQPRILPFRFGEPIDARNSVASQGNSPATSAIASFRVAPPPYSDPVLALFNNPQQGRLDQISVKRWHRFTTNEGKLDESAVAPAAVPLLKLENDALLLAKLTVDQGVVYQWSIRANDTWSDLPIRPAFLPLLQRLILFSQGTTTPREVANTKQEARIDPLSETELSALAQQLGAEIHVDAKDYLTADSQRQTGWEIWRWVLLGVLAILFGELFVEKRITRGAT